MQMRVASVQSLTSILDATMPGIKNVLRGWRFDNGKDKLSDFVEEFWHYDLITKRSEKQFAGIHTISSQSHVTKLLVQEAVHIRREVDKTLELILTQMQEIAISLKEYPVVRSMNGVGDRLAPRLIGENCDVTRFHSGSALIAFAGIDAHPFQLDQFNGTNRRISKRGVPGLRKPVTK